MNDQELQLSFFGTPDLCTTYLDALQKAGLTPSVIVTAPDRPVGRKQVITPPPVKVWAQEHDIQVIQPETLDDDFKRYYQSLSLDGAIVIAYGKIIPQAIIDAPTHGTINVHYSLLPRWRGATPVEATILNGDEFAGVSIQQMVFKLDAGPVIADAKIPLDGDETTPNLKTVLTHIGSELLIDTLPLWLNSAITPTEQNQDEITTCKRLSKQDGEISLDMPGSELWRRYRAYDGWPGIFFFTESGKRIKITEATYENEQFTPIRITPEGKPETDYETWIQTQ